jgi:hypothetical protein
MSIPRTLNIVQTPLSVENGHEAVAMLLLKKAVDVGSMETIHGQTQLSLAEWNGYDAVVKLLLKAVDRMPVWLNQ